MAMQVVRSGEAVQQDMTRGGERRTFAQRVKEVPECYTVHGMYVVGLGQLMKKVGKERSCFRDAHRFRYYPLRDYMGLVLDCAAVLYANLPMRQALQALGRLVIPTFADSIGGQVIMSVASQSWDLALSCLASGYKLSLRPGRASLTHLGRGQARVELRNIWLFGDSYQVGVVEGLMTTCRVEGIIKATALSPCDTDLFITWTTH